MASIFRRHKAGRSVSVASTHHAVAEETIVDGSLKYTLEHGGNGSGPSYQEASGAPVETTSPLGTTVGAFTVIFLNFGKMVGTGVYSTPASILKSTGSVGMSLLFWFFGWIIAVSSLSVYLEYAAYFPNRSGSEVVYLEQAYPRPRYLFPLAFAFQSVALSFSASNAVVLSQYLFRINGHTPHPWELKGVAIAGYTVAVLFVLFNTRLSFRISNAIGAVKLLTLVFIAITGLVVLGGHTSVKNPTQNFKNAFEGTGHSGYGVTNAFVKVIFAYAGYENAFNVVNEVNNPIKTIKRSAFAALTVTGILYELANIAYFAAIPKAEMKKSSVVTASIFFEKVFGSTGAVKGLSLLIAISAFGNLIAVLLGSSRLIRECGRQGVLPFPRFWASTWPFGTPTGPYFVKWALTMVMIAAPPAGDAFNFAVDLALYPSYFFNLCLAVGLILVRYRRKKLNLPRPEFRAFDILVYFTVLINLVLLGLPFIPPPGGAHGGDVSFWYATYAVTGIGIIIGCFVYYATWMYGLPHLFKYRVRQETLVLDGDATAHRLVKIPIDKLAAWDETHDAVGRVLGASGSDTSSGQYYASGKVEPKSEATV